MTDTTEDTPQEAIALKSKHLWPVVDFWEDAGVRLDAEEPDSQRWVIKLMVDDLRALDAALAAANERIATLDTALRAAHAGNMALVDALDGEDEDAN